MAAFDQIVFDPAYDFYGVTLVEASAGTGKTYQIQNVYLRLVLTEGLPVEKILVVTFTEAATRELRERMRAIMVKCDQYLAGTLSDDDDDRLRLRQVLSIPVRDHGETNAATAQQIRVKTALMNFDNAAIFTIHGFCHRVLQRYAFECGHDPDAELLQQDTEIIGDICRNWWRQHKYTETREPAAALFDTLGELQALVVQALSKPDAKLLPESVPDLVEALRGARHAVTAYLQARQAQGALGYLKPKKEKAIEGLLAHLDLCLRDAEIVTPEILSQVRQIVAVAESATWVGNDKEVVDMRSFAPGLLQALGALLHAGLGHKALVVESLRTQMYAAIRQRQMLTYDGMLRNVREALRDERLGPTLLRVLREDFSAALLDEFQDTDPVQYEIFDRIFAGGHAPLVFVGDPKQAIYGFRSGDVYAYYRAKQTLAAVAPDRMHRLPRNYRSATALIKAINEFFGTRQGTAFINANIRYEELDAAGLQDEKSLQIKNAAVDRPMKIWPYSLASGRVPGQNADFARHVYARVAHEITHLLQDDTALLGGRRLRPSDFAVLVTVHAEAEAIHDALLQRGVNAVKQKSGNVFDCEEAQAMQYLMQAMLRPNHTKIICTALSFAVLPCTDAQLQTYQQEEVGLVAEGNAWSLEDWMTMLDEAGKHWRAYSFVEAFGLLEKKLALRAHVVGLPDGEQRLTNLLQLVDLLYQAARSQQLGPEGLLRWFVTQLDEQSRSVGEDGNMRLHSDEDAVKIMTIFKSKGLEFPIVFVPTLWRKSAVSQGGSKDPMLAYHDENGQLILQLDKDNAVCKARSISEQVEENIRLAYVALTRAANMTYCVAINQGDPDKYAFQYLWNQLDRTQAASIDICAELDGDHPPDVACERYHSAQAVPQPNELQAMPAAWVDKTHGKASFSSLIKHDVRITDVTASLDRDDEDAPTDPVVDAVVTTYQPDWIFEIAGGAKTGDCWHAIFENLDFQADDDAITAVVDRELEQTPICRDAVPSREKAKRAAVQQMVRRTLAATLKPHGETFALRDIPRMARRSELQFDFALRGTAAQDSLQSLHAVMDTYWAAPFRDDHFLAALRTRTATIPQGYMNGFVDLVFMHENRFYIVDWKSNRLNGQISGFGRSALQAEMTRHFYYLQYMIYAVALDAFLQQRLQGYSFETHFGGVFYFFLRGVNEAGRGIFYDPLSQDLVHGLAHALTSRQGTSQECTPA